MRIFGINLQSKFIEKHIKNNSEDDIEERGEQKLGTVPNETI